ncbi:MAG TPA: hypothetical protein VN650_01125 [Gemmatimonadaceae bacterium]|jgi:hypothetical protein|nr:hypothetical protein [Gemmatimonadaceae bacterium]
MPFTRELNPGLISALNDLYVEKDSWWRALVDDKEIFIAIRPDAINAYAHGASIARITWTGRLCLRVHRKFVVIPKTTKGDEYVDLLDERRSTTKPLVVDSVKAYTEQLHYIKAAAGRLTGKEREDENTIALRCNCVLDIEAAFNNESASEQSDDDTAGGRVDIVALENGTLSLTEVKLYGNGDVRSSAIPAVCGQLQGYYTWAKENQTQIVKAYNKVAKYREELHLVSEAQPVERLDPTPRLLIVGFDRSQQSSLGGIKARIIENLNGCVPGFDKQHIRTVGSASNVRAAHLQ